MKLSIVMPTLNEEKYISYLLTSIKKQEYNDYEIIVSDGNSEDNTVKIAKNNNCKVVISKKRHPSHHRNQGAKIANGELLLFLDADTKLPQMFLKNVVNEFENRHLFGGGFYIKIEKRMIKYLILTKILNGIFKISQNIHPSNIGIAIIVKKEIHDKIKGFDEGVYIGEDYDYSKKIFKKGKFRMLNSTYIKYSPRRLEKEGFYTVIFKWIKASLYFIFIGPIRKKIIKYDFGKY
jgi:cellulose synthase/poly-beta-1,6-N-acetylglucosamine synthase-like glycosyltransferase